jgi:hypothetical protein
VAAILAQMCGDSVRPCSFTRKRSFDRIRLTAAPRLTQCCDVVNIDVKPLLLCPHYSRP